MKLYDYFRSSASYRVRIALNLKGIAAERAGVDIRSGIQFQPAYAALSPLGLVPTLVVEGHPLTQSVAIMEFLDETQPDPPLLPRAPLDRAFVRAIALAIACEIHPVNNLRIRNYLTNDLHLTAEQSREWYAHWIALGLGGVEAALARDPRVGTFCFGDTPGMADCCLVPQFYNAEVNRCPTDAYPTIARIVAACRAHPAFIAAHPDNQPDRN